MIDEQLARSWLRHLRPRRSSRLRCSRRARSPYRQRKRIPGPLRLAPYQRELVDAIADDDVEIIVSCCRPTGKSISIDAMLGYCIACEPGPMLT